MATSQEAFKAIQTNGNPQDTIRLQTLLRALRSELHELMEDVVGEELLQTQGACRLLRDMLLTLSRNPDTEREHRSGSYR